MTTLDITPKPTAGRRNLLARHDSLADREQPSTSPGDGFSAEDVITRVQALSIFPTSRAGNVWLRGTRSVLSWLSSYPGGGWQARWVAADADIGVLTWLDHSSQADPRETKSARNELTHGLRCVLLCQIALPSYAFLAAYRSFNLFDDVRRVHRPELFDRVQRVAGERQLPNRQIADGLKILAKLVLLTGRQVDQLTPEDFFHYRAIGISTRGAAAGGIHSAWEMLRGIVLPQELTLTAALRLGQRPTAELVDRYHIRCAPIRDVLIRYLNERRPGVDYGTFTCLVTNLARNFWADIEHHHPGIDTLNLPAEVAEAWKQRIRTVTRPDGSVRDRRGYFEILCRVRAFYLDIQEWALEDPSWASWAVPSPVRRGDTDGLGKHKRQVTSRIHQRIRERLPHLPTLVDAAEHHRAAQADLLKTATKTPVSATFEHGGIGYRRTSPKAEVKRLAQTGAIPVCGENLATGEQLDFSRGEDEAFWAWAILEILRHSGVRLEELLEITHLALVSYQLPDTGEIVPLLQIVPSKNNEERLLLVSPELASVLATIITRLRHGNRGRVPLAARYDPHERTTGPLLPHLFQRRPRGRHEVMSTMTVQRLLRATLKRTGLRDAAGQPLDYTPHDFRRMFSTDAVTNGLPIHITARILGHRNVTTTQSYTAVFDDTLVRTYRAFLDQRRAVRPAAEYREPTPEEWREFQQHFQLRKLELGTCGRPYGTPCKHEHACIRCPALRVDPEQRNRLIEIIHNLTDRVTEARMNGWLGEVQGLQTSLKAAQAKLSSVDRLQHASRAPITDLGIPVIEEARR